jgi:hypothetical protein
MLMLPACAEGIVLLGGLGLTLLLGSIIYLGRRLLMIHADEDQLRLLREAAQCLDLPLPIPGHTHLTWVGTNNLEVTLSATTHLELRIPLPSWVPMRLVIDTVAPPLRGLGGLIPDPRLMDWVAAGDPAELLAIMPADVRDALIRADRIGPGVCIRNAQLEACVAWANLEHLPEMLAQMQCIAGSLHRLPAQLPERLCAQACGQDQLAIRQAALQQLQANFPSHDATSRAVLALEEHSERPKDRRRRLEGRLALSPQNQDGQLSPHLEAEAETFSI